MEQMEPLAANAVATGTKATAKAGTAMGAEAATETKASPEANLASPEVFGSFNLRAIGGGPLQKAYLFRSCELVCITNDEATFLTRDLRIESVYDIRNQWEVAAHPEPYLMGAKTVALEPSTERRRKDAQSRLTAGIIGEYGAPEERMQRNYRRYAREYPLIGTALRSMAAAGSPALVHCVNGKDRTGVLCAVLLRATGAHPDDVMADYLATNVVNAARIETEAKALSAGMTDEEHAILMSFLEARPSYLRAFFDEVDALYGSFNHYVSNGLHLDVLQRSILATLLYR